jgi:hypothetical protein
MKYLVILLTIVAPFVIAAAIDHNYTPPPGSLPGVTQPNISVATIT